MAALLPTPVAIAAGNRLRRAAKTLPTINPDTGEKERRTRDQKQADLLAHWLTNCTGTSTDIRAEIAISIHRGGQTTATNLQSLCRKHHNMKSHGHLHDRHLDAPLHHVEH